jgi:hypothetical protein
MSASTALMTLFVVSVAGAVTLAFYSLGPLLGRWERRPPVSPPPAPVPRRPPVITIESIPPPPRESARVVVAMGTPARPASVVPPATGHLVLPQPAQPLPAPAVARAPSRPPAPPARPAKGSQPPPLPATRAVSIKPQPNDFEEASATIEGPRYTVVKSTRSKRRQ